MVRSKFNFFSVYILLIIVAALFSLGTWFVLHPGLRFRNKFGGTNSAIIPGLILMPFMGLLFFILLRKAVILRVGKDRLSLRSLFRSQDLPYAEIKAIRLWERRTGFGSYRPAEALTIQTTDDREFALEDIYYRNMPAIRRSLQEGYGEKIVPAISAKRKRPGSSSGALSGDATSFSGNYIFNLNGILFWVCIIGFFWAIKVLYPVLLRDAFTFFMSGFVLLFIGILMTLAASQLFYFRITGNVLEIRNHVLFWYRKAYPFEDILSIVFETPYKRSNTLRIRTTDLVTKGYGAGSLRKKHWKGLLESLRALHIPVKVEFYGELKDQAGEGSLF